MTTWKTPYHTFTCGACNTRVTGIYALSEVHATMRLHAELCSGFPPTVDCSPDLRLFGGYTAGEMRAAFLAARARQRAN